MKKYTLGIDLGGTGTKFGVVNEEGEVLCSSSIPTQQYPIIDEYCNVLCEEMKKLVARYNRIKNDKTGATFTLRSGEVIVADYPDALYYSFMECVSACPQGVELFMRCTTNYLSLKTIYHQRKNHKLKEDWVEGFCKEFIEKLPYAKEFIIGV